MINYYKYQDVWSEVKGAARTTVGKDGNGLAPTDAWKKSILLAEHSPIRLIRFKWKWQSLKSWVSVHFVRHKYGIEHWVTTQRSDRTGVDRDTAPQDAPVSHMCEANAQALINISRKRLCTQASPETRKAWQEVKDQVEQVDPALASVMVRECVYRGFCPEMHCCGYCDTVAYYDELVAYRDKGRVKHD